MHASASEPMGPPSFSTKPLCQASSARQARGSGRPGRSRARRSAGSSPPRGRHPPSSTCAP
eukprot:9708075-Alexandrium_andersonii.AAC.1